MSFPFIHLYCKDQWICCRSIYHYVLFLFLFQVLHSGESRLRRELGAIVTYSFNPVDRWIIYFADVATATLAKDALEGHCIYDGGYCKLHLTFSRHTDLSVKVSIMCFELIFLGEKKWVMNIMSSLLPNILPCCWRKQNLSLEVWTWYLLWLFDLCILFVSLHSFSFMSASLDIQWQE